MAKEIRRPMGEGEDLAARVREDNSIPGNLYRQLEEAVVRDAKFYSADPDRLMEIPEITDVMEEGIQDDSRILKNFLADTEEAAGREYSSQLEISGQHKPRDCSHHH